MTSFGSRLQEERKKRGLTQEQLADASGMGLGTIRDYEQDKRDPLASSLVKIADALKVSLDELARGVEWSGRVTVGRSAKPSARKAAKPTRKRRTA